MGNSVAWCYCLFGRDEGKYYIAMKKNIELAKIHKAKIIITTLEKDYDFVSSYFSAESNIVKVIGFTNEFNTAPKLTRYLVPNEHNFDYYLFKDSDSIVTEREISYTKKWIESGYESVIFRDHPQHVAPILGGMFGLKNGLAKLMAQMILNDIDKKMFVRKDEYLYDQHWLAKYIYPTCRSSLIVFTSFFYYSGERIVNTKCTWDIHNHIGKQHFSIDNEYNKYLDCYKQKLLSTKYMPFFSRAYQKVKLVLMLGIIKNYL